MAKQLLNDNVTEIVSDCNSNNANQKFYVFKYEDSVDKRIVENCIQKSTIDASIKIALLISLGQDYYEGEKCATVLRYLNSLVESSEGRVYVEVVVADTLQVHNAVDPNQILKGRKEWKINEYESKLDLDSAVIPENDYGTLNYFIEYDKNDSSYILHYAGLFGEYSFIYPEDSEHLTLKGGILEKEKHFRNSFKIFLIPESKEELLYTIFLHLAHKKGEIWVLRNELDKYPSLTVRYWDEWRENQNKNNLIELKKLYKYDKEFSNLVNEKMIRYNKYIELKEINDPFENPKTKFLLKYILSETDILMDQWADEYTYIFYRGSEELFNYCHTRKVLNDSSPRWISYKNEKVDIAKELQRKLREDIEIFSRQTQDINEKTNGDLELSIIPTGFHSLFILPDNFFSQNVREPEELPDGQVAVWLENGRWFYKKGKSQSGEIMEERLCSRLTEHRNSTNTYFDAKLQYKLNQYVSRSTSSEIKLLKDEEVGSMKNRVGNRRGLQLAKNDLTFMPDNFVVGEAIDDGGCFFDSLAQSLNALKEQDIYDEKLLREQCCEYYLANKEAVKDWNNEGYGGIDQYQDDEYAFVQYTKDELDEHSNGRTPILGRPHIEGKILCRQLAIEALYIIELIKNPDNPKQLIPAGVHVTADDVKTIDIDDQPIVFSSFPCLIASEGSLHFVPVLPKRAPDNRSSYPHDSSWSQAYFDQKKSLKDEEVLAWLQGLGSQQTALILQGESGMGKSSWCRHLVKLWQQNELIFHYCFMVSPQDFQENAPEQNDGLPNDGGIVKFIMRKCEHEDKTISQRYAEFVRDKPLLFVLDDYKKNQASSMMQDFLCTIVTRLPKARVVISSNESAKYSFPHHVIHPTGFTKEEAKRYWASVVKVKDHRVSFEELSNSKRFEELIQTPVLLSMAAHTANVNQQLPLGGLHENYHNVLSHKLLEGLKFEDVEIVFTMEGASEEAVTLKKYSFKMVEKKNKKNNKKNSKIGLVDEQGNPIKCLGNVTSGSKIIINEGASCKSIGLTYKICDEQIKAQTCNGMSISLTLNKQTSAPRHYNEVRKWFKDLKGRNPEILKFKGEEAVYTALIRDNFKYLLTQFLRQKGPDSVKYARCKVGSPEILDMIDRIPSIHDTLKNYIIAYCYVYQASWIKKCTTFEKYSIYYTKFHYLFRFFIALLIDKLREENKAEEYIFKRVMTEIARTYPEREWCPQDSSCIFHPVHDNCYHTDDKDEVIGILACQEEACLLIGYLKDAFIILNRDLLFEDDEESFTDVLFECVEKGFYFGVEQLCYYRNYYLLTCGSYYYWNLINGLSDRDRLHDIHCRTPLTVACEYGDESIVSLLLENGADVNSKNAYELTPLMIAREYGDESIVSLLVKNSSNVLASECQKLADAHKLNMIEDRINELNTMEGGKDEFFPFQRYEREILKEKRGLLLLRLHCAENRMTLKGDQTAFLKEEEAVDVNHDHGIKDTKTLEQVVRRNHQFIMRCLSPEIKIVGTFGLKMMMSWYAYIPGRTMKSCLLKRAKVKYEIVDGCGWSFGSSKIGILADRSADFLKESLFQAISNNDVKKVKALLAKGADKTLTNAEGYTPILWASSLNHVHVVKALLAKGADDTVKNK